MRRSVFACVAACVSAGVVLLGPMGCDDGDGDSGIPAPTNLVAMPVETSWVNLTWVDNADGEDGYRIYRDGGAGFVELATVATDFTGYNDLTVTDGEFYTYYVVAYVGATESPESNHSTVEAGEPYLTILTPPDGAVLTLGEMYDITWVTNMPEFNAEIYLSTDAGVTWPPQHQIELSWLGGSPWTWEVGYGYDASRTSWEQVVPSTNTQCRIFINHYAATGVSAWSEGTFTVTVP